MHKFYHGDWFAGKLVGLAQIKYNKLLINVYTTHVTFGDFTQLKDKSFESKNIFFYSKNSFMPIIRKHFI